MQTIIGGRTYEVLTHRVRREVPVLRDGVEPVMVTKRGGKGIKLVMATRHVVVTQTQLVRVDRKAKVGRRKRLAAERVTANVKAAA